MPHHRDRLSRLQDELFLTDGGMETTLVFHEGIDLPCFASFTLLASESGRAALRRYYLAHAGVARDLAVGFVLESATWRASPDWGARLGYSPEALDLVQVDAIALLRELRDELETDSSPMVISGCVGPRGDGYRAEDSMSADQAADYHGRQVRTLAAAGAELVGAMTMTNTPEAVGITLAARRAGLPAVVSFTVETDGRLPTGQSLAEAISEVDRATAEGPLYYMINCAHPDHFAPRLVAGEPWVERIRGLRANASRLSHAELDEATELDPGDPAELARQYAELLDRLPQLNVVGGCCGTDHRHIEQIGRACHRELTVPA